MRQRQTERERTINLYDFVSSCWCRSKHCPSSRIRGYSPGYISRLQGIPWRHYRRQSLPEKVGWVCSCQDDDCWFALRAVEFVETLVVMTLCADILLLLLLLQNLMFCCNINATLKGLITLAIDRWNRGLCAPPPNATPSEPVPPRNEGVRITTPSENRIVLAECLKLPNCVGIFFRS